MRTIRAAIESGAWLPPPDAQQPAGRDGDVLDRAVGSGNTTTAFGVGTSATGLFSVVPGGQNNAATGMGTCSRS